MYEDSIAKLYVALFSRAPEQNGLHDWYRAAILNQWDMASLAESMIQAASQVVNSDPTYIDIYPQYLHIDATDPASIRSIIESVYKTLFNKDYTTDPQGIDGWVQMVLDGASIGSAVASIVIVADGIANRSIPADPKTIAYAKAFENKIDTALYVAQKYPLFTGDFTKFQSYIQNIDNTQNSVESSITNINADFPHTIPVYEDLPIEVQSLLIDNGVKLDQTTITYSFDQTMPQEYATNIEYSNNWQPLDEHDKELAREAFQKLSSFLPLQFVEVPNDGDIRFSKVDMLSSNEAGFAVQQIYDGRLIANGIGSDIFLANNYDQDIAGLDVILHELGHALGLKHPFEGSPSMPTPKDNTLYTIMSYTDIETYLPKISIASDTNGYSYTLSTKPLGRLNYGLYDIEALQFLYGMKEKNLSNDTYDLSNLYQDMRFAVLNDDGGWDTLSLQNSNEKSTVYLAGEDELSSLGMRLPTEYIRDTIESEMRTNNIPQYYFDDIYQAIIDTLQNNLDFNSLIYQGKETITLTKESIENFIGSNVEDIIYDNILDNYIATGNGDDMIYLLHGGYDFVDGGEGYDVVNIELLPEEIPLEFNIGDIHYLISDSRVIALQNIEDVWTL